VGERLSFAIGVNLRFKTIMNLIHAYGFSFLIALSFVGSCKSQRTNKAGLFVNESTQTIEASPWPVDLASMDSSQVHVVVGDTGRCLGKRNDPLHAIFQQLYAEYVKWLLLKKNEYKMHAIISPGTIIMHLGKPYKVIMKLGEGTRGISLWVREVKGTEKPFVIKLMKLFTDTNVKKEALHYQLNHKAVLLSVLLSYMKPFPYSGLVDYLDLDETTKLAEASFAEGTLRLGAIKGISGLFVQRHQFSNRLNFYAALPKYSKEIEDKVLAFMDSVGNYKGESDVIENFVLDVDCLSIAKIDPG
jgi:hypothetical protein